MLEYKGYKALATVDTEAGIIHGEVINTNDVITFQAENAKDLEKEMKLSVDGYLDFCKEIGKSPDLPLSGKLVVRLGETLHREVLTAAKAEGKSLNGYIVDKLSTGLFSPMYVAPQGGRGKSKKGTSPAPSPRA